MSKARYITMREAISVFKHALLEESPSDRTMRRWIADAITDRHEVSSTFHLYRRAAVVALAKEKAKKARKK